jgi:hypothetical protein
MEMHSIVIAIHAISGFGASAIGVALLFQKKQHTQLQSARVLFVFLVLLELFLVLAIVLDWQQLIIAKKIAFVGLSALGVYMLFRNIQAISMLKGQEGSRPAAIVDHIGFILISLFDGFSIVSAIDLRAPGWLVAVVAVAAVVLGVFLIKTRKEYLLSHPISHS